MEIRYNIEKGERKALAQKIAELTGAEMKYAGVPSCAYVIDFFTLRKDAVLSFSDRSDTEIVEIVLQGLADAGYTSETITYPAGTTEEDIVEIDVTIESDTEEDDAPADELEDDNNISSEPLTVNISVPLAMHTVQSLVNLICMIHARGALLSKATSGEFFADKPLIDAIAENTFNNIHELIAFIREWGETNPPLKGISFHNDLLVFDTLGTAPDTDHVQAFMKLAAAMNQMSLTQKRIQAKSVDDSNEKYAFRIWLIRLGLNGAEHKETRRILMENLSGNAAFRNDEEKERWMKRQKEKREAAKAEQSTAPTTDEEVTE